MGGISVSSLRVDTVRADAHTRPHIRRRLMFGGSHFSDCGLRLLGLSRRRS